MQPASAQRALKRNERHPKPSFTSETRAAPVGDKESALHPARWEATQRRTETSEGPCHAAAPRAGDVSERLVACVFDMFDLDSDGYISMHELRLMLSGDGPLVDVLPDGQTVEQVSDGK